MKVVVMASGPSLADEDVEFIKQSREAGKIDVVIAISDVGILKAPWADALCSHDTAWWLSKNWAGFYGRLFSAKGTARTEAVDTRGFGVVGGMNSGLFGMFVARDIYKATTIILVGFDMHRRNGQHFFGAHTEKYNGMTLFNTDEDKFRIHIKQFDRFSGCEVYNCTPGSDLKKFPFSDLRVIIGE